MLLRKSEWCGASYTLLFQLMNMQEGKRGSGKVSVVVHHMYALVFQLMNMQERMYVAQEK